MTEPTANQTARSAVKSDDERMNPASSIPFLAMHLACLLVIWSGASWVAVTTCAVLFYVRLFSISGGYHRYFSHRSYKTSRAFQFILALVGTSTMQRDPLWWAAHHRHHHRYSDTEADIHSPVVKGFWWAHVGWLLCKKYTGVRLSLVPDLARFPELRFLSRYPWLPPLALAVGLFEFGGWLEGRAPELHTSGFQMLIWGFFISTVVLFHVTFLVNSVTHLFGRQRFATGDHSRNSFWIALLTMGEGWHNNHHRYQSSERQGFYWWEIDLSHYVLRVLSWLGLVWELRTPPKEIYEEAKQVVGVAVSGHPQ